MKTLTAPMLSACSLVVCSACVQAADAAQDALELPHKPFSADADRGRDGGPPANDANFAFQPSRAPGDIAAAYALPSPYAGKVFTLIGRSGEEVRLAPDASSPMHAYTGLNSPDSMMAGYWLDPAKNRARVVTFGYAWRGMAIESSTVSRSPGDELVPAGGALRLESSATRLSFAPTSNWRLQLSRGTVSGLDQLVPDEDLRRTTLSATYNMAFHEGDWQTTVAWGRSARRYREPTMGYLMESTLRFAGAHALFGRLEQVGSDELLRVDGAQPKQLFKMNKLTVGYYHEVRTSGPARFDIGAFVSRHMVPSDLAPSYGSDPTAYVMFVRVKMR